MADLTIALLNDVTPSGLGTFYSSTILDTEDYRDFAFTLAMPSTAAGSGTLDVYIEASDDFDTVVSEPERVHVLTLTNPTGTTATKFTQVTGGTTLPSDSHTSTTLRQTWNAKDENLPRKLRVKYIVGTANNFSGIRLNALVNKKV